jgi:hypothetical protein
LQGIDRILAHAVKVRIEHFKILHSNIATVDWKVFPSSRGLAQEQEKLVSMNKDKDEQRTRRGISRKLKVAFSVNMALDVLLSHVCFKTPL